MAKGKSHEQFMSEAAMKGSPDIEVIGEYTHSQTPIAIRCRICGDKLTMHPRSILDGCGHTRCKMLSYWESVKKETKERKLQKQIRREKREKQPPKLPDPNEHFLDGYHLHHMIPRFMGGDDSPENLVKLLPIDHAIAHLVRYRMYRKPGDLYAYQILMGALEGESNQPSLLKGENNPMKRPDVKAKHLDSLKNRVIVYRTGDEHVKFWKGKAFSDEHKTKISAGGKGKKKPESMKDALRQRVGEKHHLSEGVWVKGKFYGSKTQAEIELGWGKGTLSYRLKNNPEKWEIALAADKNKS